MHSDDGRYLSSNSRTYRSNKQKMKVIFEEGYEAEAVYYPEEEVWHSEEFSGYEWDTQREMRKDMLVHFICEEHDFNPMWFIECYDEDDVREIFNDIMTTE